MLSLLFNYFTPLAALSQTSAGRATLCDGKTCGVPTLHPLLRTRQPATHPNSLGRDLPLHILPGTRPPVGIGEIARANTGGGGVAASPLPKERLPRQKRFRQTPPQARKEQPALSVANECRRRSGTTALRTSADSADRSSATNTKERDNFSVDEVLLTRPPAALDVAVDGEDAAHALQLAEEPR